METVRVVLVSTYELGRQPFGLASPAAWLRAEGHEVIMADLSRTRPHRALFEDAGLIAFYLPMHTATRLFLRLVEGVRAVNPGAYLCAFGLYAPLNQAILRRMGVRAVLGGEFEAGLATLARELAEGRVDPGRGLPEVSLEKLRFLPPDRTGLPPLGAYAHLALDGATRPVGYTEASRGCRHLCRHCPIVPVYRGQFRIVQRETVLEDIRRQVAAGAAHITFGDPDFFNGPGHAMAIVEALAREWPGLTYDVTVKIEHLLKHRDLLPRLARTGCLFVTSAVESLDDAVLEKLAKGHTRADFLEALKAARAAGLALAPTFIPFTPWTTREGYRGFLRDLAGLDAVGQTAPVQLAIRLLIPAGSLLMDLPELRARVEPFDQRALVYPWRSHDPEVDRLAAAIPETIKRAEQRGAGRGEIFRLIWDLARAGEFPELPLPARATIPYLTEPWYC